MASSLGGARPRGGRGTRVVRRCAAAGSGALLVRRSRARPRGTAAGPRDQVLRDQRQLEPHRVERELVEREVLKPCLFRTPDQVLSVPAAPVQTLDLDCVAGEVGERRLETVSVGVGELQLRARVRALAADDHPRPVRPRSEIQPFDVSDLRDLRPVAFLAVLADRWTPSVSGNCRIDSRTPVNRSNPTRNAMLASCAAWHRADAAPAESSASRSRYRDRRRPRPVAARAPGREHDLRLG